MFTSTALPDSPPQVRETICADVLTQEVCTGRESQNSIKEQEDVGNVLGAKDFDQSLSPERQHALEEKADDEMVKDEIEIWYEIVEYRMNRIEQIEIWYEIVE